MNSTNYQDTLNLPSTNFPMKAALARREPEWLLGLAAEGAYATRQQRGAEADWPHFILHDGPPYANGQIHMGHAVNKVLKDMVLKARALAGYQVPYVPGWDCHGLPIELRVEKQLAKAKQLTNAVTFRQACREYAGEQVTQQKQDFMRLGVLGDWEHPYLTMDKAVEADTVRAVGKILARGHLVHGVKPVHWCVACGSALAEAEVEYQEKTSTAIDVGFAVVDVPAWEACFTDLAPAQRPATWHALIWTTTPWTLPANQAIAVHSEMRYAVVQGQIGETPVAWVLAEALVDAVMARLGCTDYQVLATCAGQALEGLQAQHPLADRSVPLILGQHVTTDAGTGLVHTAPAHGMDDFVVAKHYQLPLDNPVDQRGCYRESQGDLAGQSVFKVNEYLLAQLTAVGALWHQASLTHSYPHCWRHKKPLIFLATPQWFISMEAAGLRRQALAEITNVTWLPAWGEARIRGMIEQRPDWCISRQRTWGTPLTLIVHKDTGALHPEMRNLITRIADKIAESGIDIWATEPLSTWLSEEDVAIYEKVTDTLDVWFDSGVTHATVLQQRAELHVPADLYLEGSDQHRGWFQSSLLTAVAMTGQAPYKTVLTHGFVVDGQGRKMSKSLGNVIVPQQIIDRYGADVLRLWVAMTDYRGEMTLSDEIMKRAADLYRRIRNTARFLLGNLHDFDPQQDAVPIDACLALDQWALQCASDTQQAIRSAYDGYQFWQVAQRIHHFCSVDMGRFYLDIIKDRLYTTRADGLARRSAQTAMQHILQALVHWLAPILSFTADEIWRCRAQQTAQAPVSLWQSTWPELGAVVPVSSSLDWAAVLPVREAVNKALEQQRKSGNVGSGLDADVTLYCEPDLYARLQAFGEELRYVLITSAAHLAPMTDRPPSAEATELPELALCVQAAQAEKCARCWHRRPDYGMHPDHPALCARCADHVVGADHTRAYA